MADSYPNLQDVRAPQPRPVELTASDGGIRLNILSNHGMLVPLFCLLLLASDVVCAGKLFEWVDKHGATHFSDRAPAGLPFAEKTVKPASGAARPGIETGIRKAERILLKNAQRRNSEIEHSRRTVAQQIEQRKSRCRQARTRYHEASHLPGKAASGNFKIYRRKMNEACD